MVIAQSSEGSQFKQNFSFCCLLTEAPRISTQVSPGEVTGPRWTITFPLLQLTIRHQNIKLVSRHILHFTTSSVPLKELPLVFYQIDISIEGMFYEDVRKDFLQFSCVICNISFLVCPRVQSIILQPSRDCSSSSSNYQLLTTAHDN